LASSPRAPRNRSQHRVLAVGGAAPEIAVARQRNGTGLAGNGESSGLETCQSRRLRFRIERPNRPKPTELAEILAADLKCFAETDGIDDRVAVGAGWSEPVSGPESLIHRENTGKPPRSRSSGEANVSDSPTSRGPSGGVPCVGEQEISVGEHGSRRRAIRSLVASIR
jgi:hypothetical protein